MIVFDNFINGEFMNKLTAIGVVILLIVIVYCLLSIKLGFISDYL